MQKIILIGLILLFTACSSKKPGVELSDDIWPYELYNKFNLRTIISSYSDYLRYYCVSYPKDFYKPDKVFMPNTQRVIIRTETRLLSFEFVSRDEVVIMDEVEGAYKSRHLYKIYYNEEFDDYRTDLFFIEQKVDCAQFVLAEDVNTSSK